MSSRRSHHGSRRASSSSEAPSPFFYATAAVLLLTLFIGGASRENTLQLFICELAGLGLLAWSGWRLLDTGRAESLRFPLAIIACLLLVPLIQLVPLPFSLWATLPGHKAAVQALHTVGIADQWRPYSLQPRATFANWLALFPPIAMFFAVVGLSSRERWLLLALVPVVALLSLSLGMMQIQDPRFYFYRQTNLGSAVGLFANRNHQATLFLIAIPLLAAVASSRQLNKKYHLLAKIVAGAVAVLMILGLGFVKSRAGILLAGPVALSALMLILRARTQRLTKYVLASGVLSAVVGLALIGVFLAQPLIERFQTADVEDRLTTVPVTFATAVHYLPFGSGIGSFQDIYAGVEPLAEMTMAFWNHAHSDYVELWLEAGVLALAIFAAFAIWFGRAAWRAWRASGDTAQFARAGAVIGLIVLIHSLVDYPVRTLAIADLFALGLGLMAQFDSRSV